MGVPFYGRTYEGAKGFNEEFTGKADLTHWGIDEGVPQYFNIDSHNRLAIGLEAVYAIDSQDESAVWNLGINFAVGDFTRAPTTPAPSTPRPTTPASVMPTPALNTPASTPAPKTTTRPSATPNAGRTWYRATSCATCQPVCT